ncbi:hypothetical protein BDFG_09337, partial [Blastomyces dermatitidis ATCC 26199]
SSHIDRFTSADDHDFNVESLIENLKNMIMKTLSVLYVTESSVSLSASSAISFPAVLSQSSILTSMSDSPALTTSVPATLTSVTSDFTVSAFVISSLHFKKILYRLDKSHFSAYTLSLFLLISRIIYCIKI